MIGPCVLCRLRTTYHPKDNVVEVLKESLTLMSRDQKDNIMRKQLAADMNKTDDIFTKLLTVYLSEIDDKVASMEAMLRKLVTVKHEDSKERLLLRRKWRTLASVLDRLFVIVYIILIIISLIFLLPRPGQVWRSDEAIMYVGGCSNSNVWNAGYLPIFFYSPLIGK